MYKFTYLFLTLLCLSGPFERLMAQELTLEQKVASVTDSLNVSYLTSGILYDKAVEYVPFHKLDGTSFIDSANTEADSYRFAYAMLTAGNVNDSPLPMPLDSLWERTTHMEDAPFVHLFAMLYQYDYIYEDAITENLIVLIDSILYDVPERIKNPYGLDTLWLSSISKSVHLGLEVNFKSHPIWYLSNLALDTTKLLVNYDNGSGWQSLQVTLDTIVSYTTEGEKKIRIGYILSPGDTLICQSKLKVIDPENGFHAGNTRNFPISSNEKILIGDVQNCPIWEYLYDEEEGYGYYDITGYEECLVAGVEVSVFFNTKCGDLAIRKPLIIIEGFDPGNSNDERLLFDGQYGSDGSYKGPSLLDQIYNDPGEISLKNHLHSSDYDIFFINLKNSGLGVIANMGYVIDAIKEINSRKALAGSTETNIVIGASMGGVIGKAALRQMELDNENHETEIFLSLDSPLKGANVPLALQGLIFHTAGYVIGGKTLYERDKDVKKQHDALFCDAAKQLLYYHIDHCPNMGTCSAATFSTSHDIFYTWFENLGDLEKCEHIAISNGAIEGTGMLFNPGDELFNFINIEFLPKPAFSVGMAFFLFEGWALPGNDNGVVYHGNLTHHFNFSPFGHSSEKELKITDSKPYDAAPGGMQSFFEVEQGVPTSGLTQAHFQFFNFIPTISSLALTITDPFYPTVDLTMVEDVIENNLTYLRAYTGSTEAVEINGINQVNQIHVSLDRMHVRHLLSQVTEHPQSELPPTITNLTFNFGRATLSQFDPLLATMSKTTSRIRNNLEVSGT